MKGTHKLITDYLILIISFLIVWIQTWYLDVKMFSLARKEFDLQGKSFDFRFKKKIILVLLYFQKIKEQIQNNRLINPQPTRAYGSINDTRAMIQSEVASFYSPMDSPQGKNAKYLFNLKF